MEIYWAHGPRWTFGRSHVHYNTIDMNCVRPTHNPYTSRQRRHPTITSSYHHNNNHYCCILCIHPLDKIYYINFILSVLSVKEPCFDAACMLLTICRSFSEYIGLISSKAVSVSFIDDTVSVFFIVISTFLVCTCKNDSNIQGWK